LSLNPKANQSVGAVLNTKPFPTGLTYPKIRSDEFGPLPLLATWPVLKSVSVSGIKLTVLVVVAIGTSAIATARAVVVLIPFSKQGNDGTQLIRIAGLGPKKEPRHGIGRDACGN